MRTGKLLLCIAIAAAAGCGDDEPGQPPERSDISVPAAEGLEYDSAELARARYDTAWQVWAERDRLERLDHPAADSLADAVRPVVRDPADAETWDSITADAVDSPVSLPVGGDDTGPSVVRVQVLLDRANFSPGVMDGRWGKNTSKAAYWFQHAHGLEPTGIVDSATYALLRREAGVAPVVRYTVTGENLDGPFVNIPDGVYERAELGCLCYESPLEMLAEKFHSTPALLEQLNPGTNLGDLEARTAIWVPNVIEGEGDEGSGDPPARDTAAGPDSVPSGAANERGGAADDRAGRGPGGVDGAPGGPGAAGSANAPGAGGTRVAPTDSIARIIISKQGFYTQALNAEGEIVFHFPSTLGSEYNPSPSGEYRIVAVTRDPWFHYQPDLFDEVPDEEPDAMLPPGPNSPVGVVWMALSAEHYGIHGTSAPSTIGYVTSHGCIRLTNWDARTLAEHVNAPVPVEFR